MIGKLKDLTINRDGTQNITIAVEGDFREMFDELTGKDIDIEIKQHSKRRSMDSNNLAWVLIDKLAAVNKLKKTEVYRNAIKDIGGVSQRICIKDEAVEMFTKGWTHKGLGWQVETEPSVHEGYTNVTVYYGSSVFSTAQMSALIDSLIQDCNACGIETMTPEEVKRSLDVWQRKLDKKEAAGN